MFWITWIDQQSYHCVVVHLSFDDVRGCVIWGGRLASRTRCRCCVGTVSQGGREGVCVLVSFACAQRSRRNVLQVGGGFQSMHGGFESTHGDATTRHSHRKAPRPPNHHKEDRKQSETTREQARTPSPPQTPTAQNTTQHTKNTQRAVTNCRQRKKKKRRHSGRQRRQSRRVGKTERKEREQHTKMRREENAEMFMAALCRKSVLHNFSFRPHNV